MAVTVAHRLQRIALLGVCLAALLALMGWMRQPSSRARTWVQDLIVGERAIDAFNRLDRNEDPEVYAALVDGLNDANPRIRMMCARILSHQEQSDCLLRLESLLDDPQHAVGLEVARTLIALAPWDEVQRLVNSPTASVLAKDAMLNAFVSEHLAAAQPLLLGWMQSPLQPVQIRMQAACLLRCYPTRAVERALVAMADDEGAPLELRAAAIKALGGMRSNASVTRLLRQVDDASLNWRLREAAITGLGYVRGSGRVFPTLLRFLNDMRQPPGMREHALAAIAESCTPQATHFVMEALKSDGAALRLRAATILRCKPDPRALPALRAALKVELDAEVARFLTKAIESQEAALRCRSHACN